MQLQTIREPFGLQTFQTVLVDFLLTFCVVLPPVKVWRSFFWAAEGRTGPFNASGRSSSPEMFLDVSQEIIQVEVTRLHN